MKLLDSLIKVSKVRRNDSISKLKWVQEACIYARQQISCVICRYFNEYNFGCSIHEELIHIIGGKRARLPYHWEIPRNITAKMPPRGELDFLGNISWDEDGQPIIGDNNETT